MPTTRSAPETPPTSNDSKDSRMNSNMTSVAELAAVVAQHDPADTQRPHPDGKPGRHAEVYTTHHPHPTKKPVTAR
jgi:hypothetical protein